MSEPGERRRRRDLHRSAETGAVESTPAAEQWPSASVTDTGSIPAPGSRRARRASDAPATDATPAGSWP
ncbi:MAG: hypothetical protein AAGC49_07865, partial [Brevundimonas sp.]